MEQLGERRSGSDGDLGERRSDREPERRPRRDRVARIVQGAAAGALDDDRHVGAGEFAKCVGGVFLSCCQAASGKSSWGAAS